MCRGVFWPRPVTQWLAMWNHTHHLLRSLLPQTGRIIGPSLSTGFGTRAPGDNATFATDWLWQDFLVFAHAQDCMPDVFSFHPFLDPTGGDVVTGARALAAFLEEHDMPQLPISANEYGGSWNEVPGYPGAQLSYLANLEKSGVQSAMRACFHDAPTDNCSCGNATLNGLLTCEAIPRPRSAYWIYAAYGAMRGRMLARGAVQSAKPAAPENVVDAMMSLNLSTSFGDSATAELLVAYFPCTPRDLYSPTTVYPAGCDVKTSANKSVLVRLENLPAAMGLHPSITTRRIPGDRGVSALAAPITIVPVAGESFSVTNKGVLELTLEMAPQDVSYHTVCVPKSMLVGSFLLTCRVPDCRPGG